MTETDAVTILRSHAPRRDSCTKFSPGPPRRGLTPLPPGEITVAKSAAKDFWGWLFKEEPEHYSFADLERDGSASWDGVTNALALQHLRKVRKGDRILFYHTGKEKAVVGIMRAISDPQPDPANDKLVSVQVQSEKRFAYPVPLAVLKKDPHLKDWELIRLPRLSVMPVSAEQWNRIEALSRARV